MEVSDEGCGMEPEVREGFLAGKSTGVGLRGMRERVKQIRGTFQVQSNGNGTSVLVVLPFREDSDNAEGESVHQRDGAE